MTAKPQQQRRIPLGTWVAVGIVLAFYGATCGKTIAEDYALGVEQGRLDAAAEDSRVLVGMNTDQVEMAWGEPAEINTTEGVDGTSEEWVYGNGRSVYMDDGLVTSIRMSR